MDQIADIRKKFPFLKEKVYGRPIIYFDNAATSQRPQSVLDAITSWNISANANVHRAMHKFSMDATDHYEGGREAVRRFINAASVKEIVFTSGTTASINLLANTYGSAFISEGDVVLISEAEHHSNIVPWQMLCQRTGAVLKYIPVDGNGEWQMEALPQIFASGKVRLVSAAHISNVLGVVNPVAELIALAHAYGVPVHLDGAQGIVHEEVDVQKLDCDFYSFSGHKVFAATGTGIFYGKEALLERMPPWMGGGDMVGTVGYQKTTYAPLPLKFEAGTPNFIGAATYAPAFDFVRSVRNEQMKCYEQEMIAFLEKELLSIEGLELYGRSMHKAPLLSFTAEGAHHSDIAMLLDKMGVAVRSGLMCSEPIIGKMGQTGMVRVSLAPYNTMEECEIFIRSLRKALSMLR